MSASIQKIEKTLGGLKFAVVLISLFTLSMIIGTFVESYHGTSFVNRLIYKSPLFMGLQALLFLSIFYATLLRLPIKKRLHGFYVLHLGLLILFSGSFATYYAGIDGSISLQPNTPNRYILEPNDILYINYNNKREITYELPYTAFEKDLNSDFEDIKILKYLPFSNYKFTWNHADNLTNVHPKGIHSTEYLIKNKFVSQKFLLSLHPMAKDFQSSLKMGPLSITYFPKGFYDCLDLFSSAKFVIWNNDKQSCNTLKSLKIKLRKTSTGKSFFGIQSEGQNVVFFPELSPFPIDAMVKTVADSPFRVFNKDIFLSSPYLLLFDKKMAYFKDGKLSKKNIDSSPKLPWMDFEIKVLQSEKNKVPTLTPKFIKPVNENGKVIEGDMSSLQLQIGDKTYWLTNKKALEVFHKGNLLKIQIGNEVHRLPYEINLKNFKMKKNPGTNDPASYESFVDVYTEEGTKDFHIYMNNPMKYTGLTFYQSSYFQDEASNKYGSVLSVNYDPGRALKYLGSLLLVLGSIYHFTINRKRYNKKSSYA